MAQAADRTEQWPGQGLGLPESGPGSLASWKSRITALVLDWAFSMIVASAIFGLDPVLRGQDWRSFTILGVFFVQSALLTAFTGGSFGKLVTRIGVMRIDGQPVGIIRAIARQFMVCLVIPALVIGVHRRGLHDLTCGTVVANRR
ncbi:MAG: RDD family protein [Propionibacteriaceae bacterium]|nr:RDD family protein [Propionibacteriaceae bacterium]